MRRGVHEVNLGRLYCSLDMICYREGVGRGWHIATASREGRRPAPAGPLLRVYFLRLKNRECRVNGELWLVLSWVWRCGSNALPPLLGVWLGAVTTSGKVLQAGIHLTSSLKSSTANYANWLPNTCSWRCWCRWRIWRIWHAACAIDQLDNLTTNLTDFFIFQFPLGFLINIYINVEQERSLIGSSK